MDDKQPTLFKLEKPIASDDRLDTELATLSGQEISLNNFTLIAMANKIITAGEAVSYNTLWTFQIFLNCLCPNDTNKPDYLIKIGLKPLQIRSLWRAYRSCLRHTSIDDGHKSARSQARSGFLAIFADYLYQTYPEEVAMADHEIRSRDLAIDTPLNMADDSPPRLLEPYMTEKELTTICNQFSSEEYFHVKASEIDTHLSIAPQTTFDVILRATVDPEDLRTLLITELSPDGRTRCPEKPICIHIPYYCDGAEPCWVQITVHVMPEDIHPIPLPLADEDLTQRKQVYVFWKDPSYDPKEETAANLPENLREIFVEAWPEYTVNYPKNPSSTPLQRDPISNPFIVIDRILHESQGVNYQSQFAPFDLTLFRRLHSNIANYLDTQQQDINPEFKSRLGALQVRYNGILRILSNKTDLQYRNKSVAGEYTEAYRINYTVSLYLLNLKNPPQSLINAFEELLKKHLNVIETVSEEKITAEHVRDFNREFKRITEDQHQSAISSSPSMFPQKFSKEDKSKNNKGPTQHNRR